MRRKAPQAWQESHREENRNWFVLKLPIDREQMTGQTTEIHIPAGSGEYHPRTRLGKKLLALRNRAIAGGMKLLDVDAVLEEVKKRRGELPNDETNIY